MEVLFMFQQVHLEDNHGLDSLPSNTYFPGLLDLADGAEASVETDFRKIPSMMSAQFPGNSMKKNPLPVSRPPPLRQPFFDDGEKKLLADQVQLPAAYKSLG